MSLSRQEDLLIARTREAKAREEFFKEATLLVKKLERLDIEDIIALLPTFISPKTFITTETELE